MIVVLGELGGTDEYSLVNALKQGECVPQLLTQNNLESSV
jgi:hypothetical protein